MTDLQELLDKFDGADSAAFGSANTRLAWYGQERAAGKTHEEAIASTAERFPSWVAEVWPKRGIRVDG